MGPLQGVKIVELAGIGPGPFAGMLLSDMGADIVRVDRAQQVNPGVFDKPNLEPMYRGRRSTGVDLENPEGVELVLRPAQPADGVDVVMLGGSAVLMSMMCGLKKIGFWDEALGVNVLDTGAPFYDTYETADGKFVSLGSLEPQFYAELIQRLGLEGENLSAQMDRS